MDISSATFRVDIEFYIVAIKSYYSPHIGSLSFWLASNFDRNSFEVRDFGFFLFQWLPLAHSSTTEFSEGPDGVDGAGAFRTVLKRPMLLACGFSVQMAGCWALERVWLLSSLYRITAVVYIHVLSCK